MNQYNWNVFKMMDLVKWISIFIVFPLVITISSSSADIPQFIKLSPSTIFISPIDLDKSRSSIPLTTSFTIKVTPGNDTVKVTVKLLEKEASNSYKLIPFSSMTTTSTLSNRKPTFHIVTRETMRSNNTNRFIRQLETVDKVKLQLKNCELLIGRTIHVLLTNQKGVLTSPPIKIVKKVLNQFPLVHHETVKFYKGNIGQVVCTLPDSKPSPPKVKFLFKNASISGIHTRKNKYQIVYLSSHLSEVAVLLISELDKDDEGVYTCQASVDGVKKVRRSEKMTTLKVTDPTTEIEPHFIFSSHNSGPHFLKGTRIIETVEGQSLTLYCLFESAPIRDIVWYIAGRRPSHYQEYPPFGVIKIKKVTAAEDGIALSCSSGNSPAQVFSLRVKMIPKLVSVPPRIELKQAGQTSADHNIEFTCKDSATETRFSDNTKNARIAKKTSYKWIHNAQFVSGPSYIMKENKLLLLMNRTNLSKFAGIYQCYEEWSAWSLLPSIVRLSKDNSVTDSDQNESDNSSSLPPARRVVTQQRLTAHLNCEWPQNSRRLGSGGGTRSSYSIHWLRGNKLIKAGSDKILFTDIPGKNKQVLSVVNPQVSDAGIYTCNVYHFDSLVHVAKFQLVVVSDSSNGSSLSKSLTQSGPMVTVTPMLPLRRLVSKPEVKRVGKMLLGVLIGWRIDDSADSTNQNAVEHCRVEYERRRVNENHKWTGSGTMVPQRSRENKLVLLGDGKDDGVLGRNFETRFRIVPVLKSLSDLFQPIKRIKRSFSQNNESNLPVSREQISSNQIQDSIKSEWSTPINFTHLLDCSILLDKNPFFDTQNSVLTLNWQHTCHQAYQSKIRQSNSRNSQQPMKYPNPQIQVVYSILYREIVMTNQNDDDDDARLSLVLGGNGPVQRSESDERLLLIGSNENANQLYDKSVIFNMTSLIKDRNYSIGIYGEVRLPKSSSYFLPLSNTITITTSPNWHIRSTTSPSPSQSSSNYNRVLFLVLGSLAGVLFVVLAVMLALCLGYLVRKKLFRSHNRGSSFRQTSFPAVDLSGSAYSWLAAKNQQQQQQQQPFLYHSPPPPPPPPPPPLNTKYQIELPPASPLLLQQAPHTIGTLQHRRMHNNQNINNGLPPGFYPNLGTLPRRPPATNQDTLLRSTDNGGTIATRLGSSGLNGHCGTLSKKQFMCATNSNHHNSSSNNNNKNSPALTLPQPPNYEPNMRNKDDDYYENDLHTNHPILSNHTSTLLLGSGLSNKSTRYSPLGNNHSYTARINNNNNNRISSPWLLGNSGNAVNSRNDSSPLLLQTHQQQLSNINISPPHSPLLNDSYHGNDPNDDVGMCEVGHDSMITSSRTISQDNWMMSSNYHAANSPYADESPYCDPYYESSSSIGPVSSSNQQKFSTTPLSYS